MGKGGTTPFEVVEIIKELVDRLGQRGAARAIDLPLLSVQRYYKGIGTPTDATMQKLANYSGKKLIRVYEPER